MLVTIRRCIALATRRQFSVAGLTMPLRLKRHVAELSHVFESSNLSIAIYTLDLSVLLELLLD